MGKPTRNSKGIKNGRNAPGKERESFMGRFQSTPDGGAALDHVFAGKSSLTQHYNNEFRMQRLCEENERLKRDREALQISLREYRDIIDHLNVGILLVNPGMEVLNTNRQMLQWHPDLDTWEKHMCYRIFIDPPREEPCTGCPLSLTLRDGRIHEAVMSHHEDSGQIRSYRMITSPVFGEAGKMAGGVNIMRDVTEQLQMQKAIQESESLYRTIFELSETSAAVIRQDGTLIMVNHEFERQTGYIRRELEGHQNWEKLFVPEDLIHVENFLRDRLADTSETFKTYETRLFTQNQAVRHVLMNVLCIPETELFLVSFTDIKERRMRTAVMESERKFQEMVQSANSIIYRRTPGGVITFINRYAQEFFGYREEEIVGRNVIGTIVPPKDINGGDLAKMIRDITSCPDQYITNENENMLQSGERVWIAWANKVICDEHGAAKEVICVGQDRTAHRKMELRMKQSEEELRRKTQSLEEINIAMKVLMDQMIQEKKEIEMNVTQNVRDLISPCIDRLKKSGLRDIQVKLIEEINANLNRVVSPFLQSMYANCHFAKLTPTEIQVANLVREGKSTKEIADVLTMSMRSVDFHRENIRKKMGLNHQKINLRSYLLSLD